MANKENPTVDFEKQDIRARHVFVFLAALSALLVVVLLGLGFFLKVLSPRHGTGQVASRPGSEMPAGSARQGPLLDDDLSALRQRLLAHEDEALNHYAWVNKDAGLVRIPIDRAMDLVAQGAGPAPRPVSKPGPRRRRP